MKLHIARSFEFFIDVNGDVRVIRLSELFSAIVSDLSESVPAYIISGRFHNMMAQMVSQVCSQIAEGTGITTVALSGGVFQNRLLIRNVTAALDAVGLSPIIHRQVPCNDGGISLGQAVIANFIKTAEKHSFSAEIKAGGGRE